MAAVPAALAAQHAEPDGLLSGLDERGWATPTRCSGWSVCDGWNSHMRPRMPADAPRLFGDRSAVKFQSVNRKRSSFTLRA